MRKFRVVFAAAVSATAAFAGLTIVAAPSASAATAAFSIVSSWGNGYQGTFTVTNNSPASITSWQVEFDLPSGSTIGNSWNTQQTTSGNHYTFTNAPYNGTLSTGAATSFGFLVNGTGVPANCIVNGVSCSGGGPTSTPATTTPAPSASVIPPTPPASATASPTPSPSTAPGSNLFAAAGHSRSEIDSKITGAWQQLFHGDPGTGNRYSGQAVYYQLSSTMAYVEDIANQDVRSEGMGYAMMISVQLDHRAEFDALWNFAKSKMQQQSGRTRYFFTWHTDTSGNVRDTGIAPDGDQWIAAALAFAADRWGNGQGIDNYQNEAAQIIRAMWHQSDTGGVNMFDRNTSLPVFSPPGAVGYTDPSYCLPAFYKVFAKVVPNDAALWDKAYVAASQLLQKAPNSNTGLVADYTNFDGSPYGGDSASDDGYNHTFQEDAWRAIANANVDAAWFGTKPWHTQYSNTLERFFQSKGVTTYPSRYHVNGALVVHGQNDYEPTHAQGLVAMNSTSAISATESGRLDFVNDFWNTGVPSGKARYYDGLLSMLGLLYDSGNFKMW